MLGINWFGMVALSFTSLLFVGLAYLRKKNVDFSLVTIIGLVLGVVVGIIARAWRIRIIEKRKIPFLQIDQLRLKILPLFGQSEKPFGDLIPHPPLSCTADDDLDHFHRISTYWYPFIGLYMNPSCPKSKNHWQNKY